MQKQKLNGLIARREFRGLRQHQLADVIGVTQSHYNKLESGHVRLDVHRADKLARFLECTIEELL